MTCHKITQQCELRFEFKCLTPEPLNHVSTAALVYQLSACIFLRCWIHCLDINSQAKGRKCVEASMLKLGGLHIRGQRESWTQGPWHYCEEVASSSEGRACLFSSYIGHCYLWVSTCCIGPFPQWLLRMNRSELESVSSDKQCL